MCDLTHSYLWYASFICVTCLIHVCDMTLTCLMHIYVWHDSCICVAWIALTPKLVSQTRGGRERDSEREGRNMTRRKGERERRGGEERRNGRRDCTRKCERKWRREREREKEQRQGVRRGEEGGETARASETDKERERDRESVRMLELWSSSWHCWFLDRVSRWKRWWYVSISLLRAKIF